MRIISFSADGIKNAAEKGFFEWLKEQDADFICIQDLQCSEYDLQDKIFFPEEYNAYFLDNVDGKTNGVAIYCRKMPKAIMTGLGFANFDMEGRYIQADYENLSVACLLAPRAAPQRRGAAGAQKRVLHAPWWPPAKNSQQAQGVYLFAATGRSPIAPPMCRTPKVTAPHPAS